MFAGLYYSYWNSHDFSDSMYIFPTSHIMGYILCPHTLLSLIAGLGSWKVIIYASNKPDKVKKLDLAETMQILHVKVNFSTVVQSSD